VVLSRLGANIDFTPMNIFTSSIPDYLSVLYLVTIFITIHLIASTFRKGAVKAEIGSNTANLIYSGIFGFYLIYIVYVSILSFSGVFQTNTIPPKLILYTVLPLLIFLLVIVFNLPIYKTILKNLSYKSLILMQSFRLVGILFFLSYYHGALPSKFAIPGAVGDILTVLVGFLVVAAIDKKKSYAIPLVLLWNCLGLFDILSIMFNAVMITKEAILTDTAGIIEINNFPLCLLPSFAPATIIFLHVSIFKKFWNEKKSFKTTQAIV
jgi:hypothetical protein